MIRRPPRSTPLSLHDALPISGAIRLLLGLGWPMIYFVFAEPEQQDRKSTRLNSSHSQISYAVFCLKKKKKKRRRIARAERTNDRPARIALENRARRRRRVARS